MNTPPWALPAQQALSGFRSRELKPGGGNSAAGRSNHLVLDDTEQKIQAQIKSDHQHSQLSLGHITRIEDNQGRKDHRGEGFELRTDGHGAVRAKDGLILSTEGRPQASGHITDLSETTARLAQAQSQHDSLGDLALQHQAQESQDQGAVAQALKEQNQAIAGEGKTEGKFPELSEPHLILSSPAGIESTTPQSTHQHSGAHHAITSGGHSSVSAGKSWLVSAEQALRMFAYKAGIRIVSAVANVDMQALDKSIRFLAKVKITQTANRITFTAKEEIVINGGGSYTVFNSAGIEDGTSGAWANHAASHATPKGKSLAVMMPKLPVVQEPLKFHIQFRAVEDNTGRIVAGAPYRITLADGQTFFGQTDDKGMTQLLTSHTPDPARLEWLPHHADSAPDPATEQANDSPEC
jgi:type VI secretion system secreted protein VgrG